MKTSAHTKIGLENEDTRKLRNEVTLFSTGITVLWSDARGASQWNVIMLLRWRGGLKLAMEGLNIDQ
jgi:hypothetical protein